MTKKELVEEIRNTYERAEASWTGPDYGHNVTATVFYLSALHKVKHDPFEQPFVHNAVVEFLEEKLDEAFGKLAPEEFEQVFRLSEETR